jgi:N-acetylglutamate synthase-like GNAT family acetyltransferase
MSNESMIRPCRESDFDTLYEIINDAAQAYRGIIPPDQWHEPYMSREHLQHEIDDGVVFWGFEQDNALLGVMGMQDRVEVHLIRHAYVRTAWRQRGIGGRLLRYLESRIEKPILIGTWADATWAISFYEKHGYRLLPEHEKNLLLRTYWSIPERQVETSVVLADKNWK